MEVGIFCCLSTLGLENIHCYRFGKSQYTIYSWWFQIFDRFFVKRVSQPPPIIKISPRIWKMFSSNRLLRSIETFWVVPCSAGFLWVNSDREEQPEDVAKFKSQDLNMQQIEVHWVQHWKLTGNTGKTESTKGEIKSGNACFPHVWVWKGNYGRVFLGMT